MSLAKGEVDKISIQERSCARVSSNNGYTNDFKYCSTELNDKSI